MSESINGSVRSHFRFSRTWEDHRLLSAALEIHPRDTVLCITSAGDNVLNLLLDEPKQIVAADMLPAESALLELKLAAIKYLDYEDYLLVLGDKEDTKNRRELVFKGIKNYLPTYAQEYFSSEIVESGISTSGWFQADTINDFQRCLSRHVKGDILDEFFTCSTLEDQRAVYQQLSSGLEQTILSCLTKEHMLATGWREKHLVDIEDIHGNVATYFVKHFNRVCLTLPVSDNFYLSWWTRGSRGFSPDTNPKLAPYFLQRKNFQRLKNLVDRVTVFTGMVQDYFMQCDHITFNKVYLSNIFERMELEATQSLLETVVDSSITGGRLAYCTLLEPNKMPSATTLMRLTHLKELSTELQKKDRMITYSGFHAFEIKRDKE